MSSSGTCSDGVLDRLFRPRSIAVLGASGTPGKLGHEVVAAMIASPFAGQIIPVNPQGGEILGLPALRSLSEAEEAPDCAVVVVPAAAVVTSLAECAALGVPIAQVLSAGFAETGEEGRAAEDEIRELAQASGMRIVGPNCVGTYCSRSGVTWTGRASFTPGGVSFVSQSGGFAYDLLLSGREEGIAFDRVVSVGNCMDVQIAEFLDHLAAHPTTRVVGVYVEGVRDGRALMDAMRRVSMRKPLVVLKGGRSTEGARSVSSHTGRLAGDYELWRTALRQVGAIEVRSMESMITVLAAVAARPSGVQGDGVALVGNGGGATVLAVDVCSELGMRLADLSAPVLQRLDEIVRFDGPLPESGTPLDLPLGRLLADDGALFAGVIDSYCSDPDVAVVIPHLNLVPLGEWPHRREVVDRWISRLEKLDCRDAAVLPVLRTDGGLALEQLRAEIAERLRGVFAGATFRRLAEALEAAAALVHTGASR